MTTGYFDAFSGLSGDMIVGAMLDAGADFDALKSVVDALQLKGCKLSTRRKTVSGIEALKFEVEVLEPQPERHFSAIRGIIEGAPIAFKVARDALRVFELLAEAAYPFRDLATCGVAAPVVLTQRKLREQRAG